MSTATTCPECEGSGTYTVYDEILDAAGLEVVDQVVTETGACEICDGRGWHPAETRAEQRAREAREDTQSRARAELLRDEHVAAHHAHGETVAQARAAGAYCHPKWCRVERGR